MILIIDDDRSIRVSLTLMLERNGYNVASADGPASAMQIVRTQDDIEAILMDMNFTLATDGAEGITLLKQIKLLKAEIPVILMTAWGSIDLAVQGMRYGAFDFITKPWDNAILLERIETAVKLHPIKKQNGNTQEKKATSIDSIAPYIIGQSKGLKDVLSTIKRVAPTNAPILITGESGTGKELIAQAIHDNSKRSNKAFVKVNLGGISASLFESEMFGHKAGSFTDAKSDRTGRFALAEGGTIFLDEIGELELASQVKLLRVLQDQTYEILGDSKTRRADVRIVCATNANLQQMVADKTFREDLFYRINIMSVHLPALRERKEDIPLLVEYFINRFSEANGVEPIGYTASGIKYLQTLNFPGNIRELKNLVERTILMCQGEKLTDDDFKAAYSLTPTPSTANTSSLTTSYATPMGTLEDIEKATIEATIKKHQGNLSLVAKELGISRGALYRKIEKHGL